MMTAKYSEPKPDTIDEIFSKKMQNINLDHYDIYHFDEFTIDNRSYQYRLSESKDLMTVICNVSGEPRLFVSVWTSMDHEKRLREMHQYIVEQEPQMCLQLKQEQPVQ